jgi:hypothetical protein
MSEYLPFPSLLIHMFSSSCNASFISTRYWPLHRLTLCFPLLQVECWKKSSTHNHFQFIVRNYLLISGWTLQLIQHRLLLSSMHCWFELEMRGDYKCREAAVVVQFRQFIGCYGGKNHSSVLTGLLNIDYLPTQPVIQLSSEYWR